MALSVIVALVVKQLEFRFARWRHEPAKTFLNFF
jgi:hypothetical protein